MRDTKKKCIAKKCEDCNFFLSWDMQDAKGIRKQMRKCGFEVLFEEIPNLRGSIDGCQQATNETRNKVESFGSASIQTLKAIAGNVPQLLR